MSDVNIYGIIGIVVFYLVIFLTGIWAAWKSKSFKKETTSETLMLAGRSFGPWVGMCTLTATWVGGGFINGTAEHVFRPGRKFGLIWTQAPIGYALSLTVGGIFFAGKMRSAGYVTMLDPFYKKFGPLMAALLYIPAFLGDLFWTAAVLSALGSSLSVVLDIEFTLSIVISAAIAVVYTLFGGLYSVVYTDVIQLAFMLIGLYLSFPFAMYHDAVTPITETAFAFLNTTATSNTQQGKWVGVENLDVDGAGLYLDGYLLLIFGGIPWQAYFQRVLSAKTARSAQILSIVAAFGCIVSTVPSVIIGAIAASTDWNKTGYGQATIPKSQYRDVLPLVLHYLCPPAVAFIGLGAVSAAVMSSTDSSILSASSMFSRNVYKPFRSLGGKPSERELIWIMRIFILVIGLSATLLAINVQSTYALWYLCSDLIYVILFPQLVCVLFIESSNIYGSIVSYIMGWILRIGGGEVLIGMAATIQFPWFDDVRNEQRFPFKTFIMLLNLVTIILVSSGVEMLFRKGYVSRDYDISKKYPGLVSPELTEEKSQSHKTTLELKEADKIRHETYKKVELID